MRTAKLKIDTEAAQCACRYAFKEGINEESKGSSLREGLTQKKEGLP